MVVRGVVSLVPGGQLPRIDQTHVLNVFGQLVHLRVVTLLQLLAPLVLPHGRRLPLVDEDLGVLGVLLAQPPLLLGFRLEGLVVLKKRQHLKVNRIRLGTPACFSKKEYQLGDHKGSEK